MTGTASDVPAGIAQLWQGGRPDEAVMAVRRTLAARPNDAEAAALLTRMLAALPAACPLDRLPVALCLLDEACATGPAADELTYATGLAQWRLGRAAEALETWRGLSGEARAQLAKQLDAARLSHAIALARRGCLGEAALVLFEVADMSAPEAERTRHALAIAALRAGMPRLARLIGEHFRDRTGPADRALAALLAPAGANRLALLTEVAASSPVALRPAVVRAAAVEALHARRNDLLPGLASRLPADADVKALAGLTAGKDMATALRAASLALSPATVAALMGTPDPAATVEQQASFWVAAGQHDAAGEALTHGGDIWQPDVLRTVAVLSYARAFRSDNEIDLEAWRDVIATMTAFLEHERWLGTWLIGRLAAYEVNDDYRGQTAVLKSALDQMLDRRLSRLAAKAQREDRTEDAATVARIILELARERRAAAAIWKTEALHVADARVAVGPLFVARYRQTKRLQDFFVEQNSTVSEASDGMAEIISMFGMDAGDHADLLSGTDQNAAAVCRQWFSELGEAMAHQATGDLIAARAAAMEVFVRWAPPNRPDDAGLDQQNVGYSGLADPVATLRADAARIVSSASIAAFREELTATDFDPEAALPRLRGLIGEAVGLNCEASTRRQLAGLLLGKHEQLMRDGSAEALTADATMLRHAHQVELEGLSRASSLALNHLCSILIRQQRFAEAARYAEEAWRAQPDVVALAENWVAALLRRHEQVLTERGKPAAQEVLDQADTALEAIAEHLPHADAVESLRQIVSLLRFGAPIGELLQFPKDDDKLPSADTIAAAAGAALAQAREAGRQGDVALLTGAIDAAVAADPNHPDVVEAALTLLSDHAAAAAARTDDRLFDRLRSTADTVGKRYPSHLPLLHARARLERLHRLFHAQGPVELLHRKAILLYLAGDYHVAADLMETVIALAPRREAETLVFLAECLIAWLSGQDVDSDERDTKRELIDQVLKIAARLAAGHPRLQAARDAAAVLDDGGD